MLGIAAGPQDRYAQAHGGLRADGLRGRARASERLEPGDAAAPVPRLSPGGRRASRETHSSLERAALGRRDGPGDGGAGRAGPPAGGRLRAATRGYRAADGRVVRPARPADRRPRPGARRGWSRQPARTGPPPTTRARAAPISGTRPRGDAWPASAQRAESPGLRGAAAHGRPRALPRAWLPRAWWRTLPRWRRGARSARAGRCAAHRPDGGVPRCRPRGGPRRWCCRRATRSRMSSSSPRTRASSIGTSSSTRL